MAHLSMQWASPSEGSTVQDRLEEHVQLLHSLPMVEQSSRRPVVLVVVVEVEVVVVLVDVVVVVTVEVTVV